MNYENHEIYNFPFDNNENLKKFNYSMPEKNENHENLFIPLTNQENYEIHRTACENH